MPKSTLGKSPSKSPSEAPLPVSKKWLVDGFCRYTKHMVRSRFTAFGAQASDWSKLRSFGGKSFVAYANHIGWWDPIVAMLLRQWLFSSYTLFAPIDSAALQKYRVLSQMGFYGIEMNSFQGAADFLRTTQRILSQQHHSIWLTPEGRFCDCRDRTQSLMAGMAHVASKTEEVAFIPLAIEYPFWDEPRPLILLKMGEPIEFTFPTPKEECAQRLETALRTTQDELAAMVIARKLEAFEYVIAPKSQRLTWYDFARSWAAWFRGQPFDPRHSTNS